MEREIKSKDTQVGVCDVHRLVNKDLTLREVAYCSLCDAWICDKCSPNLAKRAYAMTLKALKR